MKTVFYDLTKEDEKDIMRELNQNLVICNALLINLTTNQPTKGNASAYN